MSARAVPPVSSVAPLLVASSTWRTTVSSCFAEIRQPMSFLFSVLDHWNDPHVDAALEYNFTKALAGKLFYVYEQFINHNWQTGALTPSLTPNANGSVFLGQNWQNYTAQIVGVTLKYKFE